MTVLSWKPAEGMEGQASAVGHEVKLTLVDDGETMLVEIHTPWRTTIREQIRVGKTQPAI